jgi:GINS complex subunit 3
MSYYTVSTILTTSSRLPCTFTLDVPGLGYLEAPSTTTVGNTPAPPHALKSGSTITLPLWLGTLLAVSNSSNPALSPFVTLDFPSSLSPLVLNALKASPIAIDLRSQNANFYELATTILELFEEDELVDVLSDTFKARAGRIADYASKARGGGQGEEFLRGLDETERVLFREAHEGGKRVRDWVTSLKKQT